MVAYAAPDTEIRQPDGDISTEFWTMPPLWSKIDEGSAVPDGTYITCPSNRNSTGECSVQNPTNAGTYTDVQIKVYVRKSAFGGANRGLNANIRINGNLQGQQTLSTNLSNAWTQYTYTWSGLNLTQSDIDTLQILFISTGRITGQNLRSVYIDYYEVILTYTTPPTCWLNGWAKRVRLTIDHNDIDAPLTNFPVLVYLSNSSGINNNDVTFIFDELQSNANHLKIAITTSDCIECYVEVEKWDQANEQAWLWVRVPSISNTTDTELHLYYDRTHADNTTYVGDTNSTPAEMVWDSNFVLVQHLGENSTVVHDSTANNNDGTNQPSPNNAIYNASGEINGCYSFTDADRIQMPNSSSLDITDNITLETFVYLNDKSDAKFIVKDDPLDIGGPGCYNLQQELRGGVPSLELQLDLGGSWVRASYATYNTGEWLYVVGTYDRTTMRLYMNGTQVATNPQTTAISSRTVNMALGNRADDTGTSYDLNGLLDEARISNTARSAAWIGASRESGIDDLIYFGPEEEEEVVVSISVLPATYPFGTVLESQTYSTAITDFIVTNEGDVTVNITVQGADTTCAGTPWALDDNAIPGADTYGLKFCRNANPGVWIIIPNNNAAPPDSVAYMNGLAVGNSDQFGLQLLTPLTITDKTNEQAGVITFTAAQAP